MALDHLALRMKNRRWHVDQEAVLRHQGRLAEDIHVAKEGFQRVSGLRLFPDVEVEGAEDDEAFDEKLFNSAPQLKVLFFDRWGVVPKYRSKATGKPSLNKVVLKDLLAEGSTEQIRGAARWLLRFREAHKTKSTYIDRLRPDSMNKKGESNTYLTNGWP